MWEAQGDTRGNKKVPDLTGFYFSGIKALASGSLKPGVQGMVLKA